jgi:ABC-type nitrate/sulfonate/bicarbonate transport system ATPase subunit
MIELRAITFRYGDKTPIFEGFDWRVAAGEAWAVLGPSGCGKSTLLYLLAGLRRVQSGQILIGGLELTKPRPKTGLILQDYGLLPWATVRENANLGLRIRRFYGPDGTHAPIEEEAGDTQERATYWLERLGLTQVQDQYPGQISGGQRQRTAIARTLALNPDLLLMDEPFASLDAPTRESLQRLVIDLRLEQALTTVIVTHSIEEAAILGEKVLALKQPPNRAPTVIPNPRASAEEYPHSAEYGEKCAELREALESHS